MLLQESLANLENALSSLASELNEPDDVLALQTNGSHGNMNMTSSATAAPPPPGLKAVDTMKTATTTATGRAQVEDKTQDAWTLSLANFDTLEDFLQADATRKTSHHQEKLKTVAVSTEGHENENENIVRYDENEEAERFVATAPSVPVQSMPAPPPPAPPQQPMAMPPPPHMNIMPPLPHHMASMPQQHHPMAVMNMNINMRMPPPPMMNVPPQLQPQLQAQPQFVAAPPVMTQQTQHAQNVNTHKSDQSQRKVHLNASDFPPLGGTAADVAVAVEDDSIDDGNVKKIKPQEASVKRSPLTFHNPAAAPVPTKLVSSSLMKPRDVQFVITSMLKSLTAENIDDFYYTQYLAKFRIVQRNGADPTIVDQVKREKFRENIEQRSKEWQEKQQSLGRIVKTDVTRPKALLAAPKLTKDLTDASSEETRIRANLWKARAQIDAGSIAYLSLLDFALRLQRTDLLAEERAQVMFEVQHALSKLHSCFGVEVTPNTKDVRLKHDTTLSLTLSLPKGQELLAKSMEKGILPHQSAQVILPYACAAVLSQERKQGSSYQKEDRLLSSFLSIINLRNPSVRSEIFVSCLHKILSVNKIREVLTIRPRAEVVHAILSRGSEVCGSLKEWKELEAEFVRLLSVRQ